MEQKKFKALFIIVNAGFSEEAVEIARECGAGGATIINARGTGNKEAHFLGMHYEPEKEMVVSLVEESIADKIMEKIIIDLKKNSRASGICYTMPIDKMTSLSYLGKKEEE